VGVVGLFGVPLVVGGGLLDAVDGVVEHVGRVVLAALGVRHARQVQRALHGGEALGLVQLRLHLRELLVVHEHVQQGAQVVVVLGGLRAVETQRRVHARARRLGCQVPALVQLHHDDGEVAVGRGINVPLFPLHVLHHKREARLGLLQLPNAHECDAALVWEGEGEKEEDEVVMCRSRRRKPPKCFSLPKTWCATGAHAFRR